MARKNAILIVAPGWDLEAWAAPTRKAEPGRPVYLWPDVPDPAAVAYALAWSPPRELFASLPNLRAIFSFGAGVDHLVFRDDIPDVPIVRVVNGDLTRRMTEWVTMNVLLHHRRHFAYAAQKDERRWHEHAQPAADEVRVGIMGMGVLGRDAAEVLARIGFKVAGWTRRPASLAGVEVFHGDRQLDAFLARTDILVVLLPLTPATRGILSMATFRKLARDGPLGGPVLINAGRGKLQVEADILAALHDGTLIGASLDVFETEPLPADSPLWREPRVFITPHSASASMPPGITADILRNIAAFERGEPLVNVVDRAARY